MEEWKLRVVESIFPCKYNTDKARAKCLESKVKLIASPNCSRPQSVWASAFRLGKLSMQVRTWEIMQIWSFSACASSGPW